MFSTFLLRVRRIYGKQEKKVIHDATKLHPKDQQRISLVDKSSKGRHVTYEEEEVETEAEEYVAITEDEIRTDVRKDKIHKKPKQKMPKNVFILVDDEDVTYLEEKRRKKIKVDHSKKVMANSIDLSENSKERREIITLGAYLEDGIIKTKQNAIRHHLTKTNLIEGGRTFQLNVIQIYKPSEGQFEYQIRKPHHLHVHNLKILMRYNPYAHVVNYVFLVDLVQVPNKEEFDK